MIDREFVEKIVELGVDSHKAKLIVPPDSLGMPKGYYFAVDAGGNMSRQSTFVPRRYECTTVASFISAVQQYANAHSVVLLRQGEFVCIIDAKEHVPQDDRITYRFTCSRAHKRMEPMVDNGIRMSQSDFVLLLRTDWKGCVDSGLLPLVRSMVFQKSAEGERTIEHGQDSVSNSVKARVASKGASIPESFVVTYTPCRHVCDYEFRQEVVLDIDVDRAQFCLYPNKDQYSDQLEYLSASIHETMRAKLPNIAMFSGKEM